MKISWGYKIAALYGGFVVMIVSMVVLSSFSRTDLERVDYYEEELKHDQKMKAIQNMSALNEEIRIITDDDQFLIQYPQQFNKTKAEVELWIYSPSNADMDRKLRFTCDGSLQRLTESDFRKGSYDFRFTVHSRNMDYFFEKNVIVK